MLAMAEEADGEVVVPAHPAGAARGAPGSARAGRAGRARAGRGRGREVGACDERLDRLGLKVEVLASTIGPTTTPIIKLNPKLFEVFWRAWRTSAVCSAAWAESPGCSPCSRWRSSARRRRWRVV